MSNETKLFVAPESNIISQLVSCIVQFTASKFGTVYSTTFACVTKNARIVPNFSFLGHFLVGVEICW